MRKNDQLDEKEEENDQGPRFSQKLAKVRRDPKTKSVEGLLVKYFYARQFGCVIGNII